MTRKTDRLIAFKDIDWAAVRAALLPLAASLVGGRDQRLAGTGDGPEDLLAEVIRRLIDHQERRPTWKAKEYGPPQTKSVIAFLTKVLKNHFYDQLKRSDYCRTVETVTETESSSPVEEYTVDRLHLIRRLEHVKAQSVEEDDYEAELYIELVLDRISNGDTLPTNQEAAEELGIEAKDIVNIKKRIQRMARRGDS